MANNPSNPTSGALLPLPLPGVPIDPVTLTALGININNSKIQAEADKIVEEKRKRAAEQLRVIKNADPNNPEDVLAAQFAAFGASNGVFEPAIGEGYESTGDRVNKALRASSRNNVPPASLSPWECRIGLTKMMVPPLNITVLNQYRTGSLSGGTLRQSTTPKYNSGHSETRISMTLYFPNHESIWGYEGDRFEINFDRDDEQVIDGFLSSLRGLITQFKYAPFLPVRNAYLNQVYDITAVALESMTVSTIQGFPFCVAVQLNMLHFNHEVFMPMIEDFNNAIHWGRFRQYLGRAASRMNQAANKNFLTMDSKERVALDRPSTYDESLIDGRILSSQYQGNEIDRVSSYSKTYDWLNGKDFDIYYVDHDPAKVIGPDLIGFRSDSDQETIESPNANKKWWQQLLAITGFDINTYPSSAFDIASQYSDLSGRSQQSMMDFALAREYNLLTQWLKSVNLIATNMGAGQLDEYIAQRAKDYGRQLTDSEYRELTNRIEAAWFAAMYVMYLRDPYLQNVLSYQSRRRGWYAIKEWEVPMRKVGLNPEKVIVNGVSVSMGNNIKSLQIQLQDKPVYQHLGGLETRCEISLTIFGEDNLLAIRKVLETVSGLSRLEHGHAVLGFLGIKNVLTALCGMKYALPIAWETDTVPGFPHVYNCRFTLTDFDVFQQKREMLSSEQQADLIEAFSKRNPFLRIKQQWAAFNAYPDMPLDVRDEEGKIIGHYEPDYYFRSFKALDDDVVNWKSYYSTKNSDQQDDPNAVNKETISGSGMDYSFGLYDNESKNNQKIRIHPDGMDIIDGTETIYQDLEWFEPFLANSVVGPYVDGLTPPNETSHPYYDRSNNLTNQFQKITNDMQYRDKSGRMIRAYPTFMLWLIDEGGQFAGTRLFDNFYGLQSVIDMSILSSEDLLGDTLTIRLSNLYSRLSTPFRDLIDEELYTSARIINRQLNRNRNLASGLSDYLVKLETIDIKPGIRVHLRMGYSANPNALDVVFNGTITQVTQGDVITVIAQSDAIELGAIVNNNDKDSNSGALDGAMLSGLWTSEPRDLMCRLLSMGSSTFKEAIAHASKGAIFSENRYGIRHFGTILYAPMTIDEEARQNARTDKMIRNLKKGAEDFGKGGIVGSIVGFFNFGMFDLISNAWNNFMRKRDYELYKRNIYPGNGLGIGQYLGGDFGDGGLNNGFYATGVDADGQLTDPATGEVLEVNNQDPRVLLNTSRKIVRGSVDSNAQSGTESFWSMNNPFLQMLGITRPGGPDDDPSLSGDAGRSTTGSLAYVSGYIGGFLTGGPLAGRVLGGIYREIGVGIDEASRSGPFDEVSFRAQTYMKSIWDIFKVCAALLPNYIVAVRPFEHRSTVFYGKPHWLYTSGVIPLSKGIGRENLPDMDPPEKEELSKILKSVEKRYKNRETTNEFYARLIGQATEVGLGDPYSSTNGVQWEGGEVAQLPLTHPASGISLPFKKGVGVRGLHLPTSESIDVDIDQHEQIAALLPQAWRHPYYMDRESSNDSKDFLDVIAKRKAGRDQGKSDISKDETATVTGEKSKLPGKKPDSDKYPSPEMETYYVAMNWDYTKGGKQNYYNDTARVLVYNTTTKKGVICSIQDKVNPRSKQVSIEIDINLPGNEDLEATTTTTASLGADSVVVSPEAWQLMDSVPGHEYMVGFVADKYALGPIVYDSTGQFNVGGPISKVQQGNNPKSVSGLPKWMNSSTNKLETTSDPSKFALRFGSTNPNIPVDFTDMDNGLRDYIGKLASEVYSNDGEYGEGRVGWDGRTKEEAEEIWDEFRERYKIGGSKYMVAIFNKAYPDLAIPEDYSGGANIPEVEPDWFEPEKSLREAFRKQKMATAENESKYQQVLKSFYDFMWQNPYNRGWLVKTADRGLDPGIFLPVLPGIFIDSEDLRLLEDVPYLGDVARGVADFGKKAGDAIDTATSAIGGFFGIGGGPNDEDKWNWDFDRAHGAFAVYIVNGPQAATSWIIANSKPGEEQQGVSGKVTEEFVEKVFSPVYDYLKSFVRGLTSVFSSLIALIRVNLMSMTYGLGMSSYMQRQANQLNRAFNDSIYFNPKYKFNSLLYLADNPFTREFGEPVVEIRQPFQRMHHINSFDHILSNGIQQNTQNVATVITATSRSKNPVTVWFDKGSPVESQKEKVVETGLWFDAPKGLLSNLLHPVSATRNFFNVLNAQPDELLAKRVALWHLKKNLQDIYSGEILVIGDPSIRPFDLVYIADAYERIYGIFEVEKVIHHFTSETGFVTSIVPNALVTINDPMRWSAFAAIKTALSVHSVRDTLRRALGVRNGKAIYGLPPRTNTEEVANTLESQILGHIDYTGGANALIKDFADAAQKGMLISTAASLVPGGQVATVAGVVGILGAWKAAGWVVENLIDQQGCYIQYLNKSGTPMDAGLSYNSGVAVGRMHVSTLFANSLRIPVSVRKNGHTKIATNDLLAKLGWQEYEVEELIRDVDLWNNEVNKNILLLSNRSPDGIPFQKINAKIVTVTNAIDGANFEVAEKDFAPNGVRLAGVIAPIPRVTAPVLDDIGTQAKLHLEEKLIDLPQSLGFRPTVALRVDPNNTKDKFGRVVAWVFHNIPSGKVEIGDSNAREALLVKQAEAWPQIEWDSFLPEGLPYTFNWSSVLAGFTNIDRSIFSVTLPGQGVEGAQ